MLQTQPRQDHLDYEHDALDQESVIIMHTNASPFDFAELADIETVAHEIGHGANAHLLDNQCIREEDEEEQQALVVDPSSSLVHDVVDVGGFGGGPPTDTSHIRQLEALKTDKDDFSTLTEPEQLSCDSDRILERLAQDGQHLQPSLMPDHTAEQSSLSKPCRLAIPRAVPYRANLEDRPMARFQAHTLNRLEVENAFLLNQNNSLNKDIQHCRHTVQALKHILAQKEEMIHRMKHEFQQAYLKTKFMESVLAEHQSLNRGQLVNMRRPSREASGFLQGFGGQEEQRLEFLLKQLEQDDHSEGEQDMGDDEIGSLSEDQEDMLDHGLGTGEDSEESEGDYSDEYSEESDDDDEGFVPVPNHRFRDLDLQTLSLPTHGPLGPYSGHIDPPSDGSSGAPLPNLYQQPNSSCQLEDIGANDSASSPRQVLRRRPRLQLSPTASGSTMSPVPSPIGAFAESPAIPSNGSDFSLTSVSSAGQNDSEAEKVHSHDNAGAAPDHGRPGSLRDSGHFPTEVFSLDTTAGTFKVPQVELPESQVKVMSPLKNDAHEDDLRKQATDSEETEIVIGPRTAVLGRDVTHHERPPQPNSHPYLGTSPLTAPSTLLSRIHIEASASSTTLTAESATSLNGRPSTAGGEQDAPAAHVVDDGAVRSKDPCGSESEYDVDEDSSEASLATTIMMPSAEALDPVGALYATTAFRSLTDTTLLPVISTKVESQIVPGREHNQVETEQGDFPIDHAREVEAQLFSSPLGFRFSTKIRGKARLIKNKDKLNAKIGNDCAAGASDAETTLPASTSVSTAVSELSVASSSLSRSTAGSVGSGPAPTLFSRIWSGLGKQTAVLFPGRQSPENARAHSSKKDTGVEVEADERGTLAQSPSPTWPLDPLRTSVVRVTGKGIGIRRLGPRTRSRSRLTSPVSVMVRGGIARAAT